MAKAGRPTKLTAPMIELARAYDFKTDGDVIPTIEGFALYLGINRDTVYAWREVPTEFNVPPNMTPEEQKRWEAECTKKRELHASFSDIVNGILQQQARLLVNNGLKGKFNANITKLILSGKHGYVEKQQTDLTTNGKDMPAPILGGVTTDVPSNTSNTQTTQAD